MRKYLLFLGILFVVNTSKSQTKEHWIYKPGVAENFKEVIRSSDPNVFKEIKYVGIQSHNMFDRRIPKPPRTKFIKTHVFKVKWSDMDKITTIYVNPETSSEEEVAAQAEKHAKILGLLPYILRSFIDHVNLHMGYGAYGGGGRGVLLYAQKTVEHETVNKKLNEIIVHEAAHNLGNSIGTTVEWAAKQSSDDAFISKYAAENPQREDVSESFLAWLILRYHRDRITNEQANTISNQIPARLKYFDDANYNMHPVVASLSEY